MSKPSSLSTEASTSSVAISWIDNASNENAYEVEMCSTVSCSNFSAVSGSPFAFNTTSFTASSLSEGSSYRFRVRATSLQNASEWVVSSNVVTRVHIKPLQVNQSEGTVCAILDNSTTACWGSGRYGQHLNGKGFVGERAAQMGDNLAAVDFGTGRSLKSLWAMSWHRCAILDDDSVKCWGRDNSYGQMGYGDTVARTRPMSEILSLGTGKVPVKLVGGMYFTCALFADGTVKCWGNNDSGQLGQGDITVRADGANEMGDNLAPINFGAGRTVKDIDAGSYHACAILDDDSLKCWGRGADGRLGYGDISNRGSAANQMGDNLPVVNLGTGLKAKSLSLGSHQSCAVLDNNKVKCWGNNTSGRLGLGDTTNRGTAAIQMGDNLSYVDLGAGHTVKILKVGYDQACAILDDDSLKCWGNNGVGQLALGDTSVRGDGAGEMGDLLPAVDLGAGVYAVSLEAQTNSDFFCALLSNSKVKCWGSNSNAQLGIGDLLSWGDAAGETGDNLPVVNLGAGKVASMISVTSQSSCALLSDDTLRCWGINDGNLGTTNLDVGNDSSEIGTALPIISLGTGLTVQTIAPGYTSCALFSEGSLKCWGMNAYGTTGQGNTNTIGDNYSETGDALPFVNLGTGRTVSKIFNKGGLHLCALLDDNSLKCWGYNAYGAVGLGDTNNRGDSANEMGDNLASVNVGTGKTVVDLSVGYYHNCALLNDAKVKCWGRSNYGQLGNGNTTTIGSAGAQMGDSLAVVDLGTGHTAKAITSGLYHTCAILDDDSVKCWGYNAYGQLGYGDMTNRGSAGGQMGDALLAVDLGTGRKAASIYAGDFFTCAILDDTSFKCWGRNNLGQLGLGDLLNRGAASGEMGDNLQAIDIGTGRTIKSVALGAGAKNVCLILDNDNLKCWGSGASGILATGNSMNIGDDAGEMGNNLQSVDFGSVAGP